MSQGQGPQPAPSGEVESLRAECERLTELVERLEQERDAYRRAAYAAELDRITDEDVQRYAREEEGLPLESFISELEQMATPLPGQGL